MSPKGEEAKPQRELIHAPGLRKSSPGRDTADRRLAWILLSPALLVLGTLTLYPALWVLWLALQYRIPVFGISRWAGL